VRAFGAGRRSVVSVFELIQPSSAPVKPSPGRLSEDHDRFCFQDFAYKLPLVKILRGPLS